MDAEHFDALIRSLVSRRSRRRLAAAAGLALGGLLARVPYDGAHDALAGKGGGGKGNDKKKKRKKKDCTCAKTHGPCWTCGSRGTCQMLPNNSTCGPCQICRGGGCVSCAFLGECATCQGEQCLADGPYCLKAYGPCHVCDSSSFTCVERQDGFVCGATCCSAPKSCCNYTDCFDPETQCCTGSYGMGIPCGEACCKTGESCCPFNFEPPDDQQCWAAQDPDACGDCQYPCGTGPTAVCCTTTQSCCPDPTDHCVDPGETCP